jgi:hypothetical protein
MKQIIKSITSLSVSFTLNKVLSLFDIVNSSFIIFLLAPVPGIEPEALIISGYAILTGV